MTLTFTWWLVVGPALGLALAPLLDRFIRWLPGEPAAYSPAGLNRRRLALWIGLPLLLLLVALRFGHDVRTPVGMVYAVWFLVIGLVDLEHRLIPNRIVLPSIIVAPVGAWLWGVSFTGMGLGVAVAFGFFLLSYIVSKRVFGVVGVAEGDLKLAIVLGVISGFPRVFFSLFAMSVLSGLVAAALMASGRSSGRDYIPFAPFMVGGAAIALFFSA